MALLGIFALAGDGRGETAAAGRGRGGKSELVAPVAGADGGLRMVMTEGSEWLIMVSNDGQ